MAIGSTFKDCANRRLFPHCLECGPETQLQHARLVSEIIAERRFSVIRIVFVGGIAAVVRVIKQIKGLEEAEELYTVTNRNPLLKPHVHAVDRQSHEVVTRYDRAVSSIAL